MLCVHEIKPSKTSEVDAIYVVRFKCRCAFSEGSDLHFVPPIFLSHSHSFLSLLVACYEKGGLIRSLPILHMSLLLSGDLVKFLVSFVEHRLVAHIRTHYFKFGGSQNENAYVADNSGKDHTDFFANIHICIFLYGQSGLFSLSILIHCAKT